jgi:cholesterol oxidase
MSLFGGAVSGIASLVVNSAALVIEVPAWSAVKLAIAPFLIEDVLGLPYVSPRWSEDTRLSRGKIVSRAVSLFHPECDVPACHMLSLMWGTGHPAVYQHDQLDEVTHRRGGDLYGSTSLCYHRHVRQIVRAGRAVKRRRGDPRYDRLPDDYLERAGDVTTPVLLVTGAENRVFGRSNVLCHRELDRVAPGRHELQVVPRYGHQDIFVGKNSAAEVFPGVLAFLESSRSAGVPRSTVKRGRESNGGVPSLRDAGA